MGSLALVLEELPVVGVTGAGDGEASGRGGGGYILR